MIHADKSLVKKYYLCQRTCQDSWRLQITFVCPFLVPRQDPMTEYITKFLSLFCSPPPSCWYSCTARVGGWTRTICGRLRPHHRTPPFFPILSFCLANQLFWIYIQMRCCYRARIPLSAVSPISKQPRPSPFNAHATHRDPFVWLHLLSIHFYLSFALVALWVCVCVCVAWLFRIRVRR